MASVLKRLARTYVKMSLQVPRGLVAFLDDLHRLGCENAKEHLERNVLAKELECLLGSMPMDIFDLKTIRLKYGEGSEISD